MRAGRWWMLGVTCLSVVVVALDLTILNIALSTISAALHARTAVGGTPSPRPPATTAQPASTRR